MLEDLIRIKNARQGIKNGIVMDLTTVLAIYGALLSTIVLIYLIKDYKVNLKIYLEWQAFYEKCHLVITNYGKRPVTIKRIIVRSPLDGWAGQTVVDNGQENALPKKLEYGEEETFILHEEVSNSVWSGEFDILIYDSEGKEYKPTLKRTYSPRYEGYNKFEKIK